VIATASAEGRFARTPASDGEAAVRGLLAVLGAADRDTWRHSLVVAAIAQRVDAQLQLDPAEVRELRRAALLHDLGKMRVPRRILHKPGPLTPDERELVRRHPAWGAEMIAPVPGLGSVAQIVLLHHERPDGLGYPYGLDGDSIPLASRIVSVCDAFETMTSGRPYQAARGVEAAVEELRRGAGTQFDADVVEALTAAPPARRLELV
jgi:putative nucleotidyltransferase with HDIG domain